MGVTFITLGTGYLEEEDNTGKTIKRETEMRESDAGHGLIQRTASVRQMVRDKRPLPPPWNELRLKIMAEQLSQVTVCMEEMRFHSTT